jgi:hypothetical protein
VAYDPDSKYAHDLESRQAAKPLAEDTARERGQFWNVDRHIRGRWTWAGLIVGFIVVVLSHLLGDEPHRMFGLGYGASILLEDAITIALGGLLGFAAAMIRRRFTGED